VDSRQSAQNSGLRRAFEARNRLSATRTEPINVFDSCQKSGVDVRFVDAPSLEGMYCRAPRLSIFVPSSKHRPWGRIVFSCAHELGHHELGHGTRADKYLAGGHHGKSRDPEELAADVFAAHFLMPRQAVVHALRLRSWDVMTLSPQQAFRLAGLFGVGYRTFIWQLAVGLQVLPEADSKRLLKAKPKEIRRDIWPAAAASRLLVVDSVWEGTSIDVEVGDFIATMRAADLPTPLFNRAGNASDLSVWVAETPGRGQLTLNGRKVAVRVSRKDYVGAWRHRFVPEADE
jgi:Zn-dependent peptidase ImmA (M78 family)